MLPRRTKHLTRKTYNYLSIRAMYGIDGQRNAVHGSDSLASAIRETGIVFSDSCSAIMESRSDRLKVVGAVQNTLAVILPEVVQDYVLPPAPGSENAPGAAKIRIDSHAVDKIVHSVQTHGLTVVRAEQFNMSTGQATALFGESETAVSATT